MTSPLVRVGIALAACLAIRGTDVFSTPPSPQQFRAGTTFVRVDAYPRRDGKMVEDLTAKDFQIFENGKPQVVETFEFVKVPPHTPDADLRDPTSVADMNRQAADPRNRIFVVFLDPVHVTMFDSQTVRPALTDLLSRVMGPSDLFAVMTPETPLAAFTLGRRPESAMAILSQPWGLIGGLSETTPRTRAEERVYSCFGPESLKGYRSHVMITSLEALVPYLGSLREERKNLILVTGELRVNFGATGAGGMGPGGGGGGGLPPGVGGRGGIPTVGVGPGGQLGIGGGERRTGTSVASECDAIAGSMRSMAPGERFRKILDSARTHNVAIHTIDTGGLRIEDNGVTDTLRTISENTDGTVVVNTNDMRAGVRRIADNLASYYLLGYASTNTQDDGLFRRIEVKTTMRGVDVSARRGYYAFTAEMRKAEAAARAAASSRPAPHPAVEAAGVLSRMRPDAVVLARGLTTTRGLDVAVEIAAREIEAGRWRTGAQVLVAATVAGRAPVAATARIEAGARGVLVPVSIDLGDGDVVAVTVTLAGADGAAVPDAEDRLDVARVPARIVEPAAVFRATPSPRSPLRPVAEAQFRRTERLHLEWTMVGAPAQRTARLLNAQGQPIALPIALVDRTDAGATVVTADLLLTAIPAGDYVVELVAERDGVTEARLTAFRLVR